MDDDVDEKTFFADNQTFIICVNGTQTQMTYTKTVRIII